MNQLPNNHEMPEGEQSEIRTSEIETLPIAPQIWVGSLSDYNNGVLHGQWIDATQDEDEVRQQITAMLERSPTTTEFGEVAEEYGIFDHDNFWGLRIDEYDDITQVTTLARLIDEHGEAFAAWAEQVGRDTATADDAGEIFLNSYMGCYRSKEDYVEGLLDDLGVVDELDKSVDPILRGYVRIDYSMLAQDLELNGDITFVEASGGGWWAFIE